MSAVKEHIIRSQAFEISLENKSEAESMQSAISNLQHYKLERLLHDILSRFDWEDSLLQFDKIELDLGVLKKSNWEQELPLRLEEQLVAFFQVNLDEQGHLKQGKRIPLKVHKLDQLAFFLLNGYLKWEANSSISLSTLVKEILRENGNGFKDFLIKNGRKEGIRKRLIHQFDDTVLEEIVSLLAGTDSTYIIQYKNNILERQQRDYLVERKFSVFREIVWGVVFAYLLVASNGFFNKRSYLGYLIKNLADQFNLSYSLLLKIIAEGLQEVEQITTGLEFKQLILSLKEENDKQDEFLSTSAKQLNFQKERERTFLHIKTFFKTGNLPKELALQSYAEINYTLRKLLQEQCISLEEVIDVKQVDSIHRLVKVVEETVLLQLIDHSKNPFFNEVVTVWKSLQEHKNKFSSSTQSVWETLNQQKGSFLLNWFIVAGGSIQKVFTSLEKILLISEKELFVFLKRIYCFIPDKYQSSLSDYFKTVKGKSQEKVQHKELQLQHLRQQVEIYVRSNEPEMWYSWLRSNIQAWSHEYFIDSATISNYLQKNVLKQYPHPLLEIALNKLLRENLETVDVSKTPFQHGKIKMSYTLPIALLEDLQNRIEQLLSSTVVLPTIKTELDQLLEKAALFYTVKKAVVWKEFEQYLQLKNTNETAKVLGVLQQLKINVEEPDPREKGIQNEKISLIDYVLKYNKLPWWKPLYNWKNLNEDVVSLVADKRFQSSLKALLKNEKVTAKLDDAVITQVWQVMDISQGKKVSKLAFQLAHLIQNQLIPLGWLHVSNRYEFNKLTFSVIEKNISVEKALSHWGELFFSWFSSSAYKQKALSFLIESIDFEYVKQLGFNWKEVMEIRSAEVLEIPFLPEQEVLRQIRKKNIDQKVLLHWFSDTTKRKKLITELSLEENFEQLLIHLPKSQKKYLLEYKELFIDFTTNDLSLQQVNGIKLKLFTILFLKVSHGTFANWSISNWADLFSETMEKEVGIRAYQNRIENVLSKINFKVQAEECLVVHVKNSYEKNITDWNELKESKKYKRLGEEDKREYLNAVYVSRAGLVLLHPYFGILFQKCGIRIVNKMIEEEDLSKAIYIMEYAATGREEVEEHELIMHKTLCGINETYVVKQYVITQEEKELVDSLLNAVTQQWKVLKGTSIEGFRQSFLQRNGKLDEEEKQLFLKVEKSAFDMLLDQLPWSITQIKLSWMKKMLWVEWR